MNEAVINLKKASGGEDLDIDLKNVQPGVIGNKSGSDGDTVDFTFKGRTSQDSDANGSGSGSTSRSGTINQVEYGSTDLSQEAIRFRQENNITGARNIAVYEYENNGQLSTIAGASQRNQGHAERLIAKELENMVIQSAQTYIFGIRIVFNTWRILQTILANCIPTG